MGIGSALNVHTPIKPDKGFSITSSQNTLPVLDMSVTSASKFVQPKMPLTFIDRDITKTMLTDLMLIF